MQKDHDPNNGSGKLLYVACPYSGNVLENIAKAKQISIARIEIEHAKEIGMSIIFEREYPAETSTLEHFSLIKKNIASPNKQRK